MTFSAIPTPPLTTNAPLVVEVEEDVSVIRTLLMVVSDKKLLPETSKLPLKDKSEAVKFPIIVSRITKFPLIIVSELESIPNIVVPSTFKFPLTVKLSTSLSTSKLTA